MSVIVLTPGFNLHKKFLIVDNTLYHRGVDSILRHFLTHEEDEVVLNDCHGGACGGHLYGLSTAQKILRVGYFWPSIFKDCVDVVKRCQPCQVFAHNMCSKPAPLHRMMEELASKLGYKQEHSSSYYP